jgi:hypothetical protein
LFPLRYFLRSLSVGIGTAAFGRSSTIMTRTTLIRTIIRRVATAGIRFNILYFVLPAKKLTPLWLVASAVHLRVVRDPNQLWLLANNEAKKLNNKDNNQMAGSRYHHFYPHKLGAVYHTSGGVVNPLFIKSL